jgi:hypothetical protein
MGVTATNAMGGPIKLYTGLVGVTEPATASAAPGAGLTDVGGTESGAVLTLSETYTKYQYDQVAMPVGADINTQAATLATNLAEPTLANLRLALNKLASAATDLEFFGDDLTNSSPQYAALVAVGKKPGGGPRLWVLRRCLASGNVGIPFKKDGQTVFPITWEAYFVSSSITPVRTDDTPGP